MTALVAAQQKKKLKPDITIQVPEEAFIQCYRPLLNSNADIDFLWGGRDSGKSRHIAQQLIIDCLNKKYFRCVLVRKVFNTIKESQWQLIKDICEEWGISHLFTFKTAPLEIICKNGNKFICRGMDEPGKLKSISNPSACWCEEGNQLDRDDFIIIMTSLRYNTGRCKLWFSFNPECEGEFEDFWLYKMFFKNRPNLFSSKWVITLPGRYNYSKPQIVEFVYNSTHTTYIDNPWCKPERAAILEQLQFIDPYYYDVFTLGKWGNRKVTDPYCYCFNESKHVTTTTLDRGLEVCLSFDFNVNPITCGVYQHFDTNIWAVENIMLPNSDIYKLCDHILAKYNGCMFLVTGDATGQNTSALVQDGINYYTIIKQKLNLMQTQMRTPTVNPKVEENRVLVNHAFYNLNVTLDKENCKGLIFDCKRVSVNDVGKIDKGDRNNPVKRADHLDNFRYYLNTFHRHTLKL